MQSQSYGFSNNFGPIRTQNSYQQGYNQNNNPFAPPSQEVQDFNQQRYNVQSQYQSQYQPQYQPQQFNQQHPQQAQFQNYQPYSYTHNNDDDAPPPRSNNNYNNNTAAPSDVFVGFSGQDDVRNRYNNDDDDVKPRHNQATQDQDNKPQKNQSYPKPQRTRSFKEYKKSVTYWGTSDCLGCITSILGFGSVLIILILLISLMAYHFGKKDVSLTSVAGGLNYMVLNLNSDPIIDLTWNGNDCTPDRSKIHFGRWPGSSRGCNCPISGLKGGYCSRDGDDMFCSDVSDIDYADMFRWEGAVFCAKRARLNVDYVRAVNCPTGFKNCCPENADPKTCSTGICMKEDVGCPLTGINIESTGNSSNILVQGKYVSLSYTPGGAPVIDMDISNNDVPCFSMNEVPKGKDYFLLDSHPNGCSTYGVDKMFSPSVDSTSQTRAISFNNLPSGILKLPGYKKITDDTTSYLSARKRITVAKIDACLSLDTEIMNAASTAANDLNRYMSGTVITAMVFHSILVLLFGCILCTVVKEAGWAETLKGRNSGAWLFCYIVVMSIELIVYIVMVSLVRSARNDLVNSKDYLVRLDKLGCFPVGPAKQVVADYDDAADVVASKLDGLATTLLAVTLIAFVPIVSGIIYKLKCRR